MSFHEVELIAFFLGTLIHGSQGVLIARQLPRVGEHSLGPVRQGLAVVLVAFFWQFGNFAFMANLTNGLRNPILPLEIPYTVQILSLLGFPIVFAHMQAYPAMHERQPGPTLRQAFVGTYYGLWIWSIAVGIAWTGQATGWFAPFVSVQFAVNVTLFLMLVFFVASTFQVVDERRRNRPEGFFRIRASRAGTFTSALAAVLFMLMLFGLGDSMGWGEQIELAARLESVPFSLFLAYRYFQFPFMDVYLREVLTVSVLLTGFLMWMGLFLPVLPPGARSLGIVLGAIVCAYLHRPLGSWVDRKMIGYVETLDEQEGRVGSALRALARLDDFSARAGEILAPEIQASWVVIGPEPRQGRAEEVGIPGSRPMWLSIGPRTEGRSYMSRHLRIARSAALEIASRYEQLDRERSERERLVEAHELREMAARAEVRALHAQINPHFLFNTLNVLSNLIHTDPKSAERLTVDLSDIFRYALESTRRDLVSFADELRFIRSYLEIERARFEDHLRFQFEIDDEALSAMIPPMMLQPLVENAIRHGIAARIGGGEVRVSARLGDGRLLVSVDDQGDGSVSATTRGSGVGLKNLRDRLERIFGPDARLDLDIRSRGTHAELVIPALTGVEAVSDEDGT